MKDFSVIEIIKIIFDLEISNKTISTNDELLVFLDDGTSAKITIKKAV